MHGTGNDFIVLDSYTQSLSLHQAHIRSLTDRHFGIGADQLLMVEKPTIEGVDFRYRIFNCDGSEVQHCGNGARCFAKFVHDHKLTDAHNIRVQTENNIITLTMQENGEVVVDMGTPVFDAAKLPFDTCGLEGRREGSDILWPLDVNGKTRWISIVSMGNPHVIQVIDDVETCFIRKDGPIIEQHQRFAQKVNVGFAQVVSRHKIWFYVYERGVGETLACGTGACAAVAIGIRRGLLSTPVAVHMYGGVLTISWDGAYDETASLLMAGPAVTVFEGEIEFNLSLLK